MNYHYVEVKIKTECKPSYFIGSMIRGAMGYALKEVTCINPSYKCEGCFTQSSCLYYKFYEEQNSFHQYRFNIELGSGKFNFGLYLFVDACDELSYVLNALEIVLTQNGLTKHNYKFSNIEFFLNGERIYGKNEFKPSSMPSKEFSVESFSPNVKIKLLTPLRIKRNNDFLKTNVDLEDILRSIYQKEQEYDTGKRAYKLDYTPSYTTTVKALTHKILLRKSNKQNKRMNMDGIIGEIAVMGLDERSYRLLKLGEIIGVGKQTVMGLGRIEVQHI
ncbi:MAG: CRISPR repeat RNA endoribonuclease Cas6 [uncultured Sulfurovum sp.]|uniref:CRISPR repeat RNA endoribonuclease Cas6 n=1 Tax=uncultured Sulfurovum sp. TaxID=269237 RepID=A0A6S6TC49_9BACT|nr:MAG: CRISPR repeat RNA endoribonuclease Cas6 [uncultured Sulfurovum sp.]